MSTSVFGKYYNNKTTTIPCNNVTTTVAAQRWGDYGRVLRIQNFPAEARLFRQNRLIIAETLTLGK